MSMIKSSSVLVYLNGVIQKEGKDYTINWAKGGIKFKKKPKKNDKISTFVVK